MNSSKHRFKINFMICLSLSSLLEAKLLNKKFIFPQVHPMTKLFQKVFSALLILSRISLFDLMFRFISVKSSTRIWFYFRFSFIEKTAFHISTAAFAFGCLSNFYIYVPHTFLTYTALRFISTVL